MKYYFDADNEKVGIALHTLEEYGAIINGRNFEFRGIEGFYEQKDGVIVITITNKPWLTSWNMIESELKKFFR